MKNKKRRGKKGKGRTRSKVSGRRTKRRKILSE